MCVLNFKKKCSKQTEIYLSVFLYDLINRVQHQVMSFNVKSLMLIVHNNVKKALTKFVALYGPLRVHKFLVIPLDVF